MLHEPTENECRLRRTMKNNKIEATHISTLIARCCFPYFHSVSFFYLFYFILLFFPEKYSPSSCERMASKILYWMAYLVWARKSYTIILRYKWKKILTTYLTIYQMIMWQNAYTLSFDDDRENFFSKFCWIWIYCIHNFDSVSV